MQLPNYLRLLHRSQVELAQAFRDVAKAHADEADVADQCELLDVVQGCEGETAMQLKWLRTRLKQAAPQALVVA